MKVKRERGSYTYPFLLENFFNPQIFMPEESEERYDPELPLPVVGIYIYTTLFSLKITARQINTWKEEKILEKGGSAFTRYKQIYYQNIGPELQLILNDRERYFNRADFVTFKDSILWIQENYWEALNKIEIEIFKATQRIEEWQAVEQRPNKKSLLAFLIASIRFAKRNFPKKRHLQRKQQ